MSTVRFKFHILSWFASVISLIGGLATNESKRLTISLDDDHASDLKTRLLANLLGFRSRSRRAKRKRVNPISTPVLMRDALLDRLQRDRFWMRFATRLRRLGSHRTGLCPSG